LSSGPDFLAPPSPVTLDRAPRITRIAHRAGNDRAALRQAIDARVDWIEVDLWYAWGRLVARHERGVWRLPVVYDKWHVRLLRERLLSLDDLIEMTAGGPQLFIDLKGTSPRLPAAIVRTLQRHRACDRAAVCGQYWPPLDAIGSAEPRIRVFHSLGRPEHVRLHLARMSGQTRSHGVSVAHWLLTPEVVADGESAGAGLNDRGVGCGRRDQRSARSALRPPLSPAARRQSARRRARRRRRRRPR
jgi:hypothetical protein